MIRSYIAVMVVAAATLVAQAAPQDPYHPTRIEWARLVASTMIRRAEWIDINGNRLQYHIYATTNAQEDTLVADMTKAVTKSILAREGFSDIELDVVIEKHTYEYKQQTGAK